MSNHPNTPSKMGGGFSIPRATSKPIDIPKQPEKTKPKEESNFFSSLRLTDTPATFSSYRQTARRKEALRRLTEYEEKHLKRIHKCEELYGNKYHEKLGLPHALINPARAGPLAKYVPRYNNGEGSSKDTTEEKKPLSIKCSIQLKDTPDQFVNTFLKK